MGETQKSAIGSIGWTDLTVANAKEVRDFYQKVVGWTTKPLDMGGYEDYCMVSPDTGETTAGVCHARGPNAKLPPQWMIYITVDDVEKSAKRCVELGGEVIDGPRGVGGKSFCVIKDPAGAVAALIER
ncbi:MAG: VOC family protein [Phycisphaerae bacterium]|jgi:predicted enzyme related to lactoylglutathione lyase